MPPAAGIRQVGTQELHQSLGVHAGFWRLLILDPVSDKLCDLGEVSYPFGVSDSLAVHELLVVIVST